MENKKQVLKNLAEGYNIEIEELEEIFAGYDEIDEDIIYRVYNTKNQLVRSKLRKLNVPVYLIDCIDLEKAYTELMKKDNGKTIKLSDNRYIVLV